jgi:hypothetical protein
MVKIADPCQEPGASLASLAEILTALVVSHPDPVSPMNPRDSAGTIEALAERATPTNATQLTDRNDTLIIFPPIFIVIRATDKFRIAHTPHQLFSIQCNAVCIP